MKKRLEINFGDMLYTTENDTVKMVAVTKLRHHIDRSFITLQDVRGEVYDRIYSTDDIPTLFDTHSDAYNHLTKQRMACVGDIIRNLTGEATEYKIKKKHEKERDLIRSLINIEAKMKSLKDERRHIIEQLKQLEL